MVCKVTADTNRVSLYATPEDGCWGDDPPTEAALKYKGYEVRMTGESLVHSKQTVVSNVIRTDRMRDTISEVAASAEGDINFELVYRDLDIFFEGAFANDFVFLIERTLPTANVSAANATSKFAVSAGTDFDNFVAGADVWVSGFATAAQANGRFSITSIDAGGVGIVVDTGTPGLSLPTVAAGTTGDKTFRTNKAVFTDLEVTAPNTIISTTTNFLTSVNLEVGQWLRTAGFGTAANNGVFKIVSIAANEIVFDTAVLVDEAAGASVVISAQRIKNGTARKSLHIEKKFGDVDKYVGFPGMRVGAMSLNVESQQLVTGTFTFMGKEAQTSETSVLGQVVPAGINPSMNATTNVGSIYEDDVLLSTALRSVALSVANNLRAKPQLGSRAPIDIGYGFVDVTGTVSAYFEDLVLYNKFIDHDESSLSFRFTDAYGNVMVFTLPRLYYTNGNPNAGGGNDDVLLPLEFTCVRDTDADAVIIMDVIPA